MDGYAVRAADTFGASESMPCYLNITGEVLMGEAPAGEVKKGCCYKIPTGGLLPAGADSVVMLEHSVPVDETMIEIIKGVGSGTNLIQKGEDISKGHPGPACRPPAPSPGYRAAGRTWYCQGEGNRKSQGRYSLHR